MFLILLIAGLAIVTRSESKAMEPPPLLEIGPDGAVRLATGPGQQNSGSANTSSSASPVGALVELDAGNPGLVRYQPGGRAFEGTRGGSAPGAPPGAQW